MKPYTVEGPRAGIRVQVKGSDPAECATDSHGEFYHQVIYYVTFMGNFLRAQFNQS